MATGVEWLRYALGENSRLIPIFLVFLALAVLTVALATWQIRLNRIPASPEFGEVVSFGQVRGRSLDIVLVVVRTGDREIVTLRTSANLLTHCHVGSRIQLYRQGQGLHVGSPGCAPPI